MTLGNHFNYAMRSFEARLFDDRVFQGYELAARRSDIGSSNGQIRTSA